MTSVPHQGCREFKRPIGVGDDRSWPKCAIETLGRFILSINDVPEIRKTFGRFQIEEVTLRYQISRGQEHADERTDRAGRALENEFGRAKANADPCQSSRRATPRISSRVRFQMNLSGGSKRGRAKNIRVAKY
jgi:hypothetical protein